MREDPIREELIELVARRMQLLSDPWRVRLLLALQERERGVQELSDMLDRSRQATSHHLNTLFHEGVVVRRQDGTSLIYSLADYAVMRLLALAGQSVTARIEELGDLIAEQ